MLFSEPKIPQSYVAAIVLLNVYVSVLFSEPKIPQSNVALYWFRAEQVSVLFSEPKIPQSLFREIVEQRHFGFSALQRAENSSIWRIQIIKSAKIFVSVLFSEPKIPQFALVQRYTKRNRARFSALQRAENSSIQNIVY